jgi:N-acyl-D-aspartate/D-glutamate deacylase
MSSANAAKLGIRDRGLVREGMLADLVVFDPARIIDKSTYSEPFHYSEGVAAVIVNGQVVLDGSRHTGAKPGKVLRSKSAGR